MSEPTPQPVTPGMYRHYMGRLYEVLHLARHSGEDNAMVVYRSDDGQVWVRPLEVFASLVGIDHEMREVRRFERVSDEVPPDDSAIISALRPMISKLPWQVGELIRNHSQQRRQLADVTAKSAQLHERLATANAKLATWMGKATAARDMLGYLADMHPLSPMELQSVQVLRANLAAVDSQPNAEH